MKKLAKFIGAIIAILLVAIILIPIIFKSQIKDFVLEKANEELKAEVALKDVSLSLFSSFPNLEVTISGFKVTGEETFENVELLHLKEMEVVVGLSALWQKQNLNLKKIKIDGLDLNVQVNANGLANYDIVKSSDTTDSEAEEVSLEEEPPTGEELNYTMSLNKYEIKDVNLVYNDASSNLYFEIEDLDHSGKGDFSAAQFDLETETEIDGITLVEGGVTLLKKVALNADVNVGVDVEKSRVDFKENSIGLNELQLSYRGFVQSNPDESIALDLTAETNEISMKDIFSLVPNAYTEDFKDVQASGEVMLQLAASGVYNEKTQKYPSFDLQLKVKDGKVQYPELPDSISEINVDIAVQQKGDQLEQTTVDVHQFAFNSAGGNFGVMAHLKDMLTNPAVEMNAKMNLALAELHRSFPMDETKELDGTISGMVYLKAKASDTAQIENITVNGNFILLDIPYQYENYPKIHIGEVYTEFSPAKITLTNLDMTAGQSKILAQGSISDFMSYALGDGILKGDLSVSANKIVGEEWMVEETSEPVKIDSMATAEGTVVDSSAVLEPLPTDIHFVMNASIDQITYEDIELKSLYGGLEVKNGGVYFNSISMKAFGGEMQAEGSFVTDSLANATYSMGFDVKHLSFQELANQVEMIAQSAPILKTSTGHLQGHITTSGQMDPYLNNVQEAFYSKGSVSTSNIVLVSSVLEKINKKFDTDLFNEINLDPLKMQYTIEKGTVTFHPFEIKGEGITSEFSGTSSIDGTCDLKIRSAIPYQLVKNKMIGDFTKQIEKTGLKIDENTVINVNLYVVGDISDPELKTEFDIKNLDLKNQVKDLVDEAVDELIDENKENLIKEAEKALEEARVVAAQVKTEANKAGNKIEAEGKKQGDKLRAEADKQAKDLVKKAKNPLEKLGAEKAAKELQKQAEKQAVNIEKEAKKQADKLRQQAQQESDKIIKQAEAELNKLKNS